ncbi:outer membrane lipoprotein-sorting protein [Sphaerotilus sp.]|uniref:outer membrane lipoprotein-sorting protein n=1 Tax=Sphaerotilus sp. TaxID=2093942 RepID=UPI00286E4E77|nr:outer membrane lipoprotein-sorting protein [Sphaerotilus sp.]
MSHTLPLLAALLLSALLPARAAEPDVARLLADADRFRVSDEQLVIETRVNTFKSDGSPDKERLYTVHTSTGRRSLVLMRSPAEQGQKVLMVGDDFWLLMPGTQRPMRITPSQKLLGDASTGDIATLRWSEDYTATLVGEEHCDTSSCWHLSLAARRAGVSYQRIELWLERSRHLPLKADLYLQSDKLAKQARFVPDSVERPTQIDEMVLRDQLSKQRETRVHYTSREKRAVPESWFNPMSLTRNPTLE